MAEVLHSGQLAQGPKVDEFERNLAKSFMIPNAITTSSGTAALEIAYELAGLKAGDEVISTPLTCAATNLPLIRMGCKIVWADVLESTLCIDPLDVHSKVGSKTKAIVQVHLGGIRADVGRQHIPVISDACQALGVFHGDYTACSFQAIKHFTTGDGGMLVCKKDSDVRQAKLLRWFGIDRERKIANTWETYRTRMMCFDIEVPGCKRQMNDIAAAMGIVGLRHYNEVHAHREKLFGIYRSRLAKVDGIHVVDGPENVHWLMTVLVENRDEFARMLFEADVDCNVVQVRNDIYKIFGGERADLPTLNSIEDKYVSIPIGMHVSEDEVNYICDKIEEGW